MFERVDQWRGDVFGDRGQALSAGDVGGVDQALESLGDLDGPVRTGVFLGGVSQVALDVRTAQLVEQAGKGVVVLVPVVHHHGPGKVGKDERLEGLQAPVAQEVIGQHAGARGQQVLLTGFRARPDPDRGLVRRHHVRQDDQAPDRLVRLRHRCGGPGNHGVHETGRGLRASQRPDQLGATVHRDRVRRDQVHTPRLQGKAIGDRARRPGPRGGQGTMHPPAPAGHFMQVMLGHRRGFQRDVHDLVCRGYAQVSGGGQVRPARADSLREVRHRAVRAGRPGQMRSRSARLLARLAPALAPPRLHRRRRPAGQVIGRGSHRGVAAVTVQTPPQVPDLRRQRHHVSPKLLDRHRLRRDHRVPGGTRRATRHRRRQNGHNRPSSSPSPRNQADTLDRHWERSPTATTPSRHQTSAGT